jgi:hypothetical protein
MTRSVICHRQNLTEFYNNKFVYEILNVVNTRNKKCNNKKQRLEKNNFPSIQYLQANDSQTIYTKPQNYIFIVNYVNTAK